MAGSSTASAGSLGPSPSACSNSTARAFQSGGKFRRPRLSWPTSIASPVYIQSVRPAAVSFYTLDCATPCHVAPALKYSPFGSTMPRSDPWSSPWDRLSPRPRVCRGPRDRVLCRGRMASDCERGKSKSVFEWPPGLTEPRGIGSVSSGHWTFHRVSSLSAREGVPCSNALRYC